MRDRAIARPPKRWTVLSLTPLKQAAPLALEEAHSATGDNAARILQSDGSNHYSLGFFVLMMGVITPFT